MSFSFKLVTTATGPYEIIFRSKRRFPKREDARAVAKVYAKEWPNAKGIITFKVVEPKS